MYSHASMNRIFRLVWSQVLNTWVPVAENARSSGKPGRSARLAAATTLASALAMSFNPMAQAAPQGAQVTSGTGSVSQNTGAKTTTITQSSPNLAMSWQSFNVGAQEKVNFVQPSPSAIAVNRIHDTHGSKILGQINANGQVYLVNPNGVLFGAGAQVNVGGLVASTLDLSDASLSSNTRRFGGTNALSGTGSVVNQGSITANNGGYVALLGNTVSNSGHISARLGTVALGAGSAATLSFAGNSLLALQIDQSTLNNLAENRQLIQADGGTVLMSAGAKDSLLASVVNNTGVIEARTVAQRGGTIVLLGGMAAGTTLVGGTLDASATNGSGTHSGSTGGSGKGGFIETSAAHIKVAEGAKITTAGASPGRSGTWLIDPVDFTISATGDITGAALSTNLGSGNVTIQSTTGSAGTLGDVNVNEAVSWAANKLTLNAQNNININANLNASGTASLALEFGQGGVAAGNLSNYHLKNGAQVNLPAGQNFSTQLGSDGAVATYTVITSLGAAGSTTGTDLQGMNGALGGKYVLGANVVAAATSGWNNNAGVNEGFMPIGNTTTAFTGTFDGLGHTISDLTINRQTFSYVGLFGQIAGSTVRNVGMLGGSIWGNNNVGGLVGNNVAGAVSNSYATGTVSGAGNVGGLIGLNTGVVSNSYATGAVTGGGSNTGGLVGYINTSSSKISNSYATGAVSGMGHVGGLVGRFLGSGSLLKSYASGAVSGTSSLGGLVGSKGGGGLFTENFWNVTSTGQATSAGAATGLTTAQMMNMASFTNWSIANTGGSGQVWRIYEGQTAPLLLSFLKPLTPGNTTVTYNGLAQTGSAVLPVGVLGAFGAATNVGTYAGTYYATQQGYDISGGGSLVITPKVITGSINTVNTTYGATYVPGSVTLNGVLIGALVYATSAVLNTTGLTSSSGHLKAGTHIGIETVSGTLTGADAGNYSFLGATGDYTVIPAPLVISGLVASNKVYDTNNVANISTAGVVYAGLLAGDALSVNATGLFNDKNAGLGKTVTLSSTLGGADADNYRISPQSASSTLADITPGILTLTATPVAVFNGQTPSGLSGTVTGFAGNETLNTATSGTLTWSTSATSSSLPGIYAIEGKGLSSPNYQIRQASSSLLTIKPSSPPQPVMNARAQLTTLAQPVVPETKYPSLVSTSLFFNDLASASKIIQPGAQLSFLCWLQSNELKTQESCRAAL